MKVDELLMKHGRHLEGCSFFDGKPECDCGFLSAFAEMLTLEASDKKEGVGEGLLGPTSETQD